MKARHERKDDVRNITKRPSQHSRIDHPDFLSDCGKRSCHLLTADRSVSRHHERGNQMSRDKRTRGTSFDGKSSACCPLGSLRVMETICKAGATDLLGNRLARSGFAAFFDISDWNTFPVTRRIECVLTTDPGMGVIRHVDAGYEEAIEFAAQNGVKIPIMKK